MALYARLASDGDDNINPVRIFATSREVKRGNISPVEAYVILSLNVSEALEYDDLLARLGPPTSTTFGSTFAYLFDAIYLCKCKVAGYTTAAELENRIKSNMPLL